MTSSLGRCIFALMTASCSYDWTVVPDAGSKNTIKPEPCKSNNDCDDTAYCKWADRLCGKGETGSCTTRPKGSDCDKEEPVCGCGTDPTIKVGTCSFAVKGVDVSGTCK